VQYTTEFTAEVIGDLLRVKHGVQVPGASRGTEDGRRASGDRIQQKVRRRKASGEMERFAVTPLNGGMRWVCFQPEGLG
jgi:hypothetical protein